MTLLTIVYHFPIQIIFIWCFNIYLQLYKLRPLKEGGGERGDLPGRTWPILAHSYNREVKENPWLSFSYAQPVIQAWVTLNCLLLRKAKTASIVPPNIHNFSNCMLLILKYPMLKRKPDLKQQVAMF